MEWNSFDCYTFDASCVDEFLFSIVKDDDKSVLWAI